MKILDYGRGFRYICTKPKSEIHEKNDIFITLSTPAAAYSYTYGIP